MHLFRRDWTWFQWFVFANLWLSRLFIVHKNLSGRAELSLLVRNLKKVDLKRSDDSGVHDIVINNEEDPSTSGPFSLHKFFERLWPSGHSGGDLAMCSYAIDSLLTAQAMSLRTMSTSCMQESLIRFSVSQLAFLLSDTMVVAGGCGMGCSCGCSDVWINS